MPLRARSVPRLALLVALTAGCGASEPDVGASGADPTAAPPECASRPADAPTPRSEVGMVLDAKRGRLVVHGGNVAASERCEVPLPVVDGETWAFHLDCGSWERLTPSGGPGPLSRHAAVLDAARDRMLVFGGRAADAVGSSDVWAFDLATDSWSRLSTTGEAPPPLSEAIAQLDVQRDRLLVFGGDPGGFVGTGELYALDLVTLAWTPLVARLAPSPRLYHASAMVGGELVVFGGTAGLDPPYLNDLHAFDPGTETWRDVPALGAPPDSRFGAELVADAARGRLLVAFGHDATDLGNRNDVWSIDLETRTWSRLHEGDVPNRPPTGPCEFPADFTTIERGAPERRYSVGLAATDTEAYFFGGKADCGYLNDVWRLDLATGDWHLERASTGGEVCLRTGRADCATLCF